MVGADAISERTTVCGCESAVRKVIMAGLASVLLACAGGSSPSGNRDGPGDGIGNGGESGSTVESGTGNNAAADDGTIWVRQGTSLMAFDTATAKEGPSAWVENAPDHVSCKNVQMTAGAASQIWVGCDDGTILVVDKATANKQLIQVEGGSSLGLWSTDIAGDYAYGYASTTVGKGCNLMRFDMASVTLQQRATIGEGFFGIDKILVDADAVWLLAENDFHLVKVDPTTLAVSAVVPLGEDPANPTGPRVDTRGLGNIEQIGNKIWAVDASSTLSSLISIDKITLTTTWVDSLADIAALGDGGVGVTANHTSLFAWNCDSSKQGTIVRLDGNTGQRVQTYTVGIGGLCNRLTFTERKLYAPSAESPYKLVQMDLQSGAITAAFTFANPVEEVVRR